MRVIRSQADSLLQIDEKELAAMRIGLAHRYFKSFSKAIRKTIPSFSVYHVINLNFPPIKLIR